MSNIAFRNERDNSNSTKIMLTNVDLIENVAVMTCTKISSTLQCTRCKTKCHVMNFCKRTSSNQCSKCHKVMSVKFESSTVHQFSNLLGFLSISDCQVVDINVVECDFSLDCLSCSKQIAVNGIHYGQKYKACCFSCNQKVALIIGGVKLLPSKPSGKLSILPTKKEKKSKDLVVIQPGEPLPEFGICKHYKKSYRWLRFPCCGNVFPCDICHNEKEMDHEMKFASRMICGFCSKEQPYTKDKPCVSCTSSMTKMSASHWEGGKGCRNKTQLSRSDKEKYSGMNKTISKKAQDLEKEKKKG